MSERYPGLPEGIETREFTAVRETRTKDGGEPVTVLTGYAAVFDSLSEDLGGFREKIAPGAFKRSIKNPNVMALIDHMPNKLLGSSATGRVTVSEDRRGLATEITPVMTSYARDLEALLDAGEKTKMSFGFRTVQDKWEKVDGEDIRTLLEVDVFDVSVVTNPAYPATDVSVARRSLAEAREAEVTPEPKAEEPEGAAGPEKGADRVAELEAKIENMGRRVELLEAKG